MEYKQRIILNSKLGKFTLLPQTMPKQNNIQFQAIMNLLYIGDDQEPSNFYDTFAKKQHRVLQEHTHKAKSNTLHVKKSQCVPELPKVKNQSLGELFSCRRRSSQNKENLKNILKKLQNSPSPRPRKTEPSNELDYGRVQTQVYQASSKSKSKYVGNRSLEMTKNSVNKFFDKKRDKQFIKKLIKAKIVEKMKKVEIKKSQKKVYDFGNKTDTLKNIGTKTLKVEKTSVLPKQKSNSRSNFLNLLWQEKKINNPVLGRKTTKLNLNKLFY